MEHPYRELPNEGPYEARLGHALITVPGSAFGAL
jgi:hypothetical protein